MDPEELWSLGDEVAYAVEITFSAGDAIADFDAIFRRLPVAAALARRDNGQSFAGAGRPAWSQYANAPLLYLIRRKLVPDLRRHLEQKLPSYMMPSAFVALESLPLTPNGKVDRTALPAPEPARAASCAEFAAPRTPTERELTRIWAQVLRIEQVGIHDNFFDLGGHSLLATQLISRINGTFPVKLPVAPRFRNTHDRRAGASHREGRGDRAVAIRSACSSQAVEGRPSS